MNVFVTDVDPQVAAANLCNSHVVKMCLETAQLLATCYPPGTLRYKHTHVNYPCAVWARASLSNFRWLLAHGLWIAEEYAVRYGRDHASAEVIESCLGHDPAIPDLGLTPFARAIKEPWKSQTAHLPVVEAYRAFYLGDKARFARWAPRARPPEWWPDQEA